MAFRTPHVSKFPTMFFIVSSVHNAPFPPSIHAPDLLQTIRNLWTLTLLMLLSVQTKTINIRLSSIDSDMQILCNYAKAVLLRISYFCFLQENLNPNYQSGCKCTISH